MTLAHQLARLVMAEQIYRACTISRVIRTTRGH
ncbi:MAG: 23S rRNA (pseudouridine(1915)-N(3))-methyltransferase RlmH [Terracidiphilus sp.]